MCRESDFKLREYFGQPTTHSICVKELHFQDVDVPYESETESKFDINSFADSPFTNEQSADQKLYPVDVCPENDSEMGPDEIPVDVATIKTDLKTSDLLKYAIFIIYSKMDWIIFEIVIFFLQRLWTKCKNKHRLKYHRIQANPNKYEIDSGTDCQWVYRARNECTIKRRDKWKTYDIQVSFMYKTEKLHLFGIIWKAHCSTYEGQECHLRHL